MANLPIHPVTGLQALGFTKRGPIWPVIGASEDPPAGDPPAGDPPAGEPPEGKTFTQADLDRIIGERLARENISDLKAAADELAKIKDGEKTELQRLQDQFATESQARQEAESKALAAELERTKISIAAAKGIPITSAGRLTGTTAEEIEADADKFLADFGPKTPLPNPQQGNGGGGQARSVEAGAAMFAARKPK